MHVLSVASEIFPLLKTGGLADVAGALPAALAKEGVAMRTLVPGYPAVMQGLKKPVLAHEYGSLFGGPARLLSGKVKGLNLFILDAPHLYDRPGNPYSGPDGRDWPDNARRFAALGRVAADLGLGLLPGYAPEVVHAHDWQAGLAPAFLHFAEGQRAGSVATIHNIAFQGVFPATFFDELGLPSRAFTYEGVEYFKQVGFLKAALQLADRVTTVSPTYAVELRTPEGGMGFDELLRLRAASVSGILNGIDTNVWDPAKDTNIANNFSARKLDLRPPNKRALQATLGLREDPNALLFGVISRLSHQKGLDLLLEALPLLVASGAQLALVGTGDKALEVGFAAAAAANPGKVGVRLAYDEALAHLMQAGCDALLVPSRFEPCGLTQLCALHYGCLPVVARMGGLADTVIDASEMALVAGVATGVQFSPVSTTMLESAISRTADIWTDRAAWRQMQENGMWTNVGWGRPAVHYANLYRRAAADAKAGTHWSRDTLTV